MHDVVIIGAGPAGISAALWCDELGLDTGLRAHNGRELLARFSEPIGQADFDLWTNVEIESVNLKAKRISLQSSEELQSIGIIIATGVRRRQLGIPGEEEFVGHGIIESATRDRELFAGKDVCVIGGGDAAAENALLLAEVCPTVTIVHRGKSLKARREFVERLDANHCITVFTESVVTCMLGNEELEAVEILRKDALKPFQMAVRGVLVRAGFKPNSELFREELQLDEKGYIVVTGQQATSVANVFAVGDVSNPLAPTISGATGAGATAAKVIAARLIRK